MNLQITTENGSRIEANMVGNAIELSASGPHAPQYRPASLSLTEVEELQKGLGKLAAKLRVARSRNVWREPD